MAGVGSDTDTTYSPPGSQSGRGANGMITKPTFQVTKTITYGTSNQIYSASSTVAADAPSGAIPSRIELTNKGAVPVMALIGYETYSDETTDVGATKYLHVMLMPGEVYTPSIRAVISTEAASTQFNGTALSNQVPASVMYTDSTADVDHATASTIGSDATHTTLNLESGHSKFFRVGDLIRIENEICEVTATGTGADIANSTLTIIRGVHGSTAATHADDVAVRFPFFNAYHDFDKYSVAQTDSNGKFKCYNFFGVGRASSAIQGIVPGGIAFKFYEAGYQNVGLSGITASTNSGLAVSTTYAINITVDGGSEFADLSFVTDSANVNFGGANGILSKLQEAFNTQYYTSGNLFEKKVYVGIVNGDIKFTSGSRLSTSAISLANPTSGASEVNFFGNGRIPAIGTSAGNPRVPDAIAARLPDDVLYDRITYATSSNSGAFGYDDGYGRLYGMCSGTINYETGAIDMIGCPPNAEFVYSVAHTSGFSGKLVTGANAIVEILANTASQKRDGIIDLRLA